MKSTKRVTSMNLNATKLILLATMLALSSSAFADKKYDKKGRHFQQKQFVYGEVIKVTPVYREVRVNHPVKECWSEPVRYPRRDHYPSDRVGKTLAGGLIGGIIGHQFGGGSGKDLATAVGTIIGAQAGNNSSRSHYDQPSYDTRHTQYEERCETQNRYRYEEVVDGYRVSYRYKGNRYQTNMPYDPGERIKLKVSVEPVF